MMVVGSMVSMERALCTSGEQHSCWSASYRRSAHTSRQPPLSAGLSRHASSRRDRRFEASSTELGHRKHCRQRRHICLSRNTEVEEPSTSTAPTSAGEDAAAFDASQQSTAKWSFFTAELAVVLAIMYAVGQLVILQQAMLHHS